MKAIKILKQFLQVGCGISFCIGIMQACSSIDFESPLIKAILTFCISGLFFLLSIVCQRYEDWKKAESIRIRKFIRKYHDASRVAGLPS